MHRHLGAFNYKQVCGLKLGQSCYFVGTSEVYNLSDFPFLRKSLVIHTAEDGLDRSLMVATFVKLGMNASTHSESASLTFKVLVRFNTRHSSSH